MIQLINEKLTVSISEDGAEIRSIFNKMTGKELLWHADPRFWGRTAPVLFPIVGSLYNQRYTYADKTYTMSQHGFLRDQRFICTHQTESSVTLEFNSNHTMTEVYPFEHNVVIRYQLIDQHVTVSWHVENVDEKTMYYSIGAHPAFMMNPNDNYEFTIEETGDVNRYVLEGAYISAVESVTLKPIPITEAVFKDTTLIFDNTRAVTMHNKSTGEAIIVTYDGFEYVGLWSPYKDGTMAPFICIEPWVGIADAVGGYKDLSQKRGIQKLESQASKNYSYTIEIA